jgi:LysM repeat protein
MISILRTSILAALGCLATGATLAQDGTGLIDEIRLLKKTVEQQSKQIETLTQQVNRLATALEGKSSPANPSPAAAAAPGNPNTPVSAPASSEEFATPAPGTKADSGAPKHVVVKGETLTSIAKHYNITLADLQKANKDINDRKLQIGQTILLPPNAQPKNPEPTPTEKANP